MTRASSSTLLLTGSRSFTGKHLVPLLQQRGFTVVGLERAPSPSALNHHEVVCDLTDADALATVVREVCPTHVLHLAALSFAALEHEEPYYQVNLFGTQNLLRALANLPTPPEKIILASTANIYGIPPVGSEILDESTPPNPVNHYAISKLAMEFMAKTWFDRLPILITRPFNYIGPGQDEKFVIPKIVAHFRARLPRIEVGNLNVSRDFSDVRDVSRSYADLLDCHHRSTVVNLCSGNAYPLSMVFELLRTLTGHTLEIAQNPAFMRANEIPRLLGSNAKLREMTGFAPNTPLETTLRTMLEST